jgi:SAM-dependent methyltransferase
MTLRAHLDHPHSQAMVDPLCLRIEGWLIADGPRPETVEFWIDGQKIGESALLYPRPDVAAAHGRPEASCLGFVHFGHVGSPRNEAAKLEIRLRRTGQSSAEPLIDRTVRLVARDYRKNHYGVLLEPTTTAVYRRENIYGSGPSLPVGDPEVLGLLKRHLTPRARVLDVGCGLGWYGTQLLADGIQWQGVEMKPGDCSELARQGLPHHHVDGRTLPFPDGTFDAAMAIEVLEHTDDPRSFISEIRRVSPRLLMVSVPNIELIPYLQDYQSVPWHLLEADHKNFFTRWNLAALLREFYPRVEVMAYGRHPLPTAEGTPLYYHLFAVATGP